MKRLISLSFALLIILTAFSGCKTKVLDLVKEKTETTTVVSTYTTKATQPASAEPEQTTKPKAVTTSKMTEKQTKAAVTQKAATQAKTTIAPVLTTSKPQTTTAKAKTTHIQTTSKPVQTTAKQGIQKDGSYTSKADVSLYIHTYNKLPKNFITKSEADALGWQGGSVEPYAPGKCIGGDYFGNYEGLLEKANGREYTECDIDTLGAGSRGAKRIVFSNDGLIYYTGDHYATFTRLY